jgi:GntR family transcriptional repressor for pyruvate dehydrogenase complex
VSVGALHSRIEQLIEERGLEPGQRLPSERELARILGVSRPSLREAMQTLQTTGRIRVRHGSGVWVSAPDAMHRLAQARAVGLRELFAMREVLEVPAAGWAVAAGDDPAAARLHQILDSMERTADIDELRRLDIEFHLSIAEMAGNRFLAQTMGVLHEMLRNGMETTLTIPGRLQRSRREHRRIADAILARDSRAAQRAMRAHIASAQRAGLARFVREEESG